MLPFVGAAGALTHLVILHQTGSNNILGVDASRDKIVFAPYFSVKDTLGAVSIIALLANVACAAPWYLGDPENFIPANPLVTPIHIQPE